MLGGSLLGGLVWCALKRCTKRVCRVKTAMALFAWPYFKNKMKMYFKMNVFRKFNS